MISLQFSKQVKSSIYSLAKEKLFSQTHLSRDVSGLKQIYSQYLTPFIGKVFHAFSHAVIDFYPRVSPRRRMPSELVKGVEILCKKWFQKLSTFFDLGHLCLRKDVTPLEDIHFTLWLDSSTIFPNEIFAYLIKA